MAYDKMVPGTYIFWETALGSQTSLDRTTLRNLLFQFHKFPDIVEESSQICLITELITTCYNILSDNGYLWLNRALESTSWDGMQFVSVPINMNNVRLYLRNV